MSQAYYINTIEDFLLEDSNAIVGKLNIANLDFKFQWTRTTSSWLKSLEIFKNNFNVLIDRYSNAKNWTILLEYEIPRLLRRIDAVIIAEDLIFVIEYKDDRKEFKLADRRQAEDYALDLQDFHLGSRDRVIIPMLLAPFAKDEPFVNETDNKLVQNAINVNRNNFFEALLHKYYALHNNEKEQIDTRAWNESTYSPTPTIIQAAQVLFAGHSVESISKSGAINLHETTNYLTDIIEKARANNEKVVCFVTGVPGAGKTLVGLNLIHKEQFKDDSNAAYFSGNGPLINVLRHALTRDDNEKEIEKYSNDKTQPKPKKYQSAKKINSKIQNLHKFIKDGIRSADAPFEKIVVFDEAQRCWNAIHFYNQTKRNQNREKEGERFDPILKSEAEILFEIMDKHEDWAIIIALVGSGQEINTGEGGIGEWGKVLLEKFINWQIHISPQLLYGDQSIQGSKLFNTSHPNLKINTNKNLHLSVSQRSFKAENLNDWVNAVLDNDSEKASNIYKDISNRYPICLTRNLSDAKSWLKNFKQGNKRIGLITSSGALRLRQYGITTKEELDEAVWFLNEEDDIRSSDFLELAATEFGIQGLEIDWSCICWDADLRRENNEWVVKNFVRNKWQYTKDFDFILNSYRVLLTRAREGMIIWIPEGDAEDKTRLPEIYDPIYDYLIACGAKEINY